MLARKKSGFTLIELLVVIAIIAILAAILFPVFARAREAARKSTCQSNMKECAIALQTYWNDYDATLPSSANSMNGITTWTVAESVTFGSTLGVIPPGLTGDPKTVPYTWCQKLYNSMRSKEIMFCPSDSGERNPAVGAGAYTTPVSYWWKLAIDRAWLDAAIKCKKEGDFGYNADQIVFYESKGFHSSAQQGLRNDVMINVAFLDTHVKNVSLANSNHVSTSTVYQTSLDDTGEPNYFNFDNNAPMLVGTNPPPAGNTVTFYDPRQYSDRLP